MRSRSTPRNAAFAAVVVPAAIASLAAFGGLTACAKGERTVPIAVGDVPPELVFARAHVDDAHDDSDVLTAAGNGLGERAVIRGLGIERGVRLHPDGIRVVFTRELRRNDPATREVFVGAVDASFADRRLTSDGFVDDDPCWTPDGTAIVWSSDRTGAARLWRMNADATDRRQLSPDGPHADEQPVCGPGFVLFRRTTDRGRLHRLTLDGHDLGPVALAPAPGGDGIGDGEPDVHPDGDGIAFVRTFAAASSVLASTRLSTGVVTLLSLPLGEDRFPRYTPIGDRLLFSRSLPAVGRDGLRLHVARSDGTDAVLLQPDRRYETFGAAALPRLGPYVAPGAPQPSIPADRDVTLLAGFRTLGNVESLRTADGRVLAIATSTIRGREVAAIGVRTPLQAPTEVADVTITVVARTTRTDADSFVRIALWDTIRARYDTVVERVAPTEWTTSTFTFSHLRYVDRDGRLRFEVIADLASGAQSELQLDVTATEWRPLGR